jgi:hypothetical protein
MAKLCPDLFLTKGECNDKDCIFSHNLSDFLINCIDLFVSNKKGLIQGEVYRFPIRWDPHTAPDTAKGTVTFRGNTLLCTDQHTFKTAIKDLQNIILDGKWQIGYHHSNIGFEVEDFDIHPTLCACNTRPKTGLIETERNLPDTYFHLRTLDCHAFITVAYCM